MFLSGHLSPVIRKVKLSSKALVKSYDCREESVKLILYSHLLCLTLNRFKYAFDTHAHIISVTVESI